jgi:hypothetical protein
VILFENFYHLLNQLLVLYKHGPQHFHASLIVIVSRTGEKTNYEYHTNERIAETTGKNLLYLEIHHPTDISPTDYFNNLDKFEVKEVMIQRHSHELKEK